MWLRAPGKDMARLIVLTLQLWPNLRGAFGIGYTVAGFRFTTTTSYDE